MLDFICMAPVNLPGARRKRQNAKKKKYPQSDSNPKPWDLKSDALPTELIGFWCKLYYLNDLYTRIMKWSVFCLVHVLFCVTYYAHPITGFTDDSAYVTTKTAGRNQGITEDE